MNKEELELWKDLIAGEMSQQNCKDCEHYYRTEVGFACKFPAIQFEDCLIAVKKLNLLP